MMTLTDNTSYSSTPNNIETFLSLQNIANKKISDILDENDNNLLIYPYSFDKCEDGIDQQCLLSLQTHWKEKQCTKATLQTGNIIGFISANGHAISIHSRFSPKAEEDFFLHYMLQKVLCINIVNLSHGTTDEQIFNFLLYLFPKLLNEALMQGVYKEYQQNEYNDANLRGRIDINIHLKKNVPFNGRVAYRTREFSHDNHVTQLIRHTLDYIGKSKLGKAVLENNAETRTCVAQIISATPRYNKQDREKVIKKNSKIVTHPYYSQYAPLQKLCLRILRHEKVKYRAQDDNIHGIIFDTSYLWEEYIATILTQEGFKHPNNKKGIGRIYLAKNKKIPRYPDFYRERDSTIIDAKYKWDTNRDDTNQMVTYMYRLQGRRGVFVHPNHTEGKEVSFLLGYGEENNAELQIYNYPIPQTASDYNRFTAGMMLSETALKSHFQPKM